MFSFLKRLFSNLKRLHVIETLVRDKTIPQLVEVIENNPMLISPCEPTDVDFIMKHKKWIHLLHRGFRKQPCLYYSLFCLCFEVAAGRKAEMNVCISRNDLEVTDGHCWLTRNGQVIHKTPDFDETGYGECLYKDGRIAYWLRKADIQKNDLHCS